MRTFRLGLGVVAVVVSYNIGHNVAQGEWPSLADRERWTPAMVERRAESDMNRHEQAMEKARHPAPVYVVTPPRYRSYDYPMALSTSSAIFAFPGSGSVRFSVGSHTMTNASD